MDKGQFLYKKRPLSFLYYVCINAVHNLLPRACVCNLYNIACL